MKRLRLHNISNHTFCYQNWFINECARKNLYKISESESLCRRTYVPINTADTDLLKIIPVKIFLNVGNYFRTLQLGF